MPSAEVVAAWWGAVTGTLVLVWDIVKWARDGARVHVEIQTGMVSTGGGLDDDDEETARTQYILVTAVNRGDQPTTITNLLVHQFASRWKQFRKKGRTFFTLPMGPSGGTAIPHVLQPGTKWIGTLKQAGMNLDDGHIHRFGLMHTASKRGVWQTVKLPPPRSVAPSCTEDDHEAGGGVG